MLLAISICSIATPLNVQANELQYSSSENDNYVVTHITDKDEIRQYLEDMGEEYDPNLLEVYRFQSESENDDTIINQYNNTRGIFTNEYYIKNKAVNIITDVNKILKQYNRPAGKVSISETITISNIYNLSGKVTVEILESQLGFNITESKSFKVTWSNTYSHPITIEIYPIYEMTTGVVWEDDVFDDDLIGYFNVKRAIGDDIRVYAQY